MARGHGVGRGFLQRRDQGFRPAHGATPRLYGFTRSPRACERPGPPHERWTRSRGPGFARATPSGKGTIYHIRARSRTPATLNGPWIEDRPFRETRMKRPWVSGHRRVPVVTACHWVRLVSAHRRVPGVTDYHWVRLARGLGGRALAQLTIGFVWFSGPRRVPVVTAYHWVRLARGLGGRALSQLTIGFLWSRGLGGCQALQLTIGFVWRGASAAARLPNLPLGSFGLGASEGVSRYSLPLGSSENRGRHDCNYASSAPPRPRPFSWGGVTIPMVMTVRLVSAHRRPRAFPAYHWLRLVSAHRRPRAFPAYHWLRLVSAHRRVPVVTACHWVRLARGIGGCQSLQLTNGFVWREGHRRPRSFPSLPLASFGLGPSAGASRYSLPMGSFGAGEGDLLERSRRIDTERGREGEPSSTNTIEEGAEAFQVFLRLGQRNPRHPG